MRLCVKVGGALVERADQRSALARALAARLGERDELTVVHGGGRQVRELAARLGLDEERHEGLRVTCAETAGIVTRVLAGEVNKHLVGALVRAGLAAVGCCGADLGLFSARRKRVAGADLGYVGELTGSDVDSAALRRLLDGGLVPVLATPAPERDAPAGAPFLNVNADEAAAPIAVAARADELCFLSDVDGILDETGKRIASLDRARAAELVERGTVSGGMVPKLRAALAAVDAGLRCVRVTSAIDTPGTEVHA